MTLFVKSVWKILLVNDIINSNKLLHLLQKGTHSCKNTPFTTTWLFRKSLPGNGRWQGASHIPLLLPSR